MVLAHVIIAMVGDQIARVKCNTCQGEHAYRPPPSASEATAKRRRAERKNASAEKSTVKATAAEYDTLTKDKDLSKPKVYAVSVDLAKDDVIEHKKFGVGLVTEVKEGKKAHVAFPDGGKILIYGRAS